MKIWIAFFKDRMNMNKLLVAGFIASVAMTSAKAEVCRDGGFYVGLKLGASFDKMKYKNSLEDQADVVDGTTELNSHKFESFTTPSSDGQYYLKSDVKTTSLESAKFSKRKTKFVSELGLGYDFRINDVMIGIEVNFGKKFGKNKKTVTGMPMQKYDGEPAYTTPDAGTTGKYDDETAGAVYTAGDVVAQNDYDNLKKYNASAITTFRLKNKFYTSIMPRIGYLITPNFELFATGGVKITGDKLTITFKESEDATDEGTYNKSKTKCIPVVGAGARYTFSSGIFATLEYNYNFKAKIKKDIGIGEDEDVDLVTHKMDHSSHDIKLGLGYRF